MAASIKDISNRVIIPKTCRERFLPLDTPAGMPLRRRGVESAGVSDLRAPYCIGRSAPHYHVVVFTLGGSAAWRSVDAAGTLKSGDLWFGAADHAYEYKATPRWHVAWFHLRYEALRHPGGQRIHTRHSAHGSQVNACMLGLLAETKGRVAESYAEILGLLLDREMTQQAPQVEDDRVGEWAALWQTIADNLQHPWNIEEMAKRAHVSPVQFHRITMRLYGAPPLAYLTNMRMQRGAEMLRQTTYKLDQIAQLVGYSTAFAFSKAFKRRWDESPQQFRKSRSHR